MNEGRRKKKIWNNLCFIRVNVSSLTILIDNVGLSGLDIEFGVVSSSYVAVDRFGRRYERTLRSDWFIIVGE
jgi:hypothetical protein